MGLIKAPFWYSWRKPLCSFNQNVPYFLCCICSVQVDLWFCKENNSSFMFCEIIFMVNAWCTVCVFWSHSLYSLHVVLNTASPCFVTAILNLSQLLFSVFDDYIASLSIYIHTHLDRDWKIKYNLPSRYPSVVNLAKFICKEKIEAPYILHYFYDCIIIQNNLLLKLL